MKKNRYKIVPSCYLVLIKGNKTLLTRRCNTGFEDGNYGLVSGHGEKNETFTDSLIREVFEESGLKVKKPDIKVAHVMHRKGSSDERVDVFFVAKKWSGKLKIMEPEKCDDMDWFDLNNLPKNTIDYIVVAINSIRKGFFYSEYGWTLRHSTPSCPR